MKQLAAYDKALEIDPRYTNAWNNKGRALGELQKYDEAISCYDKALEIDAGNIYAWNSKALSLYNMQKYQDAISSL